MKYSRRSYKKSWLYCQVEYIVNYIKLNEKKYKFLKKEIRVAQNIPTKYESKISFYCNKKFNFQWNNTHIKSLILSQT
jgi:hypothetical protein